MIEEEDSAKPLTDEQIAKKLDDAGIHVTRPARSAKVPRRHENSQHSPTPGKRAEAASPVKPQDPTRHPAIWSSSPGFPVPAKKHRPARLRRHGLLLRGQIFPWSSSPSLRNCTRQAKETLARAALLVDAPREGAPTAKIAAPPETFKERPSHHVGFSSRANEDALLRRLQRDSPPASPGEEFFRTGKLVARNAL